MTPAARLEAADDDRHRLVGDLDFGSARAVHAAGLSVIARSRAGARLVVDCAGLTRADSAALAVMLDWLAAARRAGRALTFERLPESLVATARISEVDELLVRGVA